MYLVVVRADYDIYSNTSDFISKYSTVLSHIARYNFLKISSFTRNAFLDPVGFLTLCRMARYLNIVTSIGLSFSNSSLLLTYINASSIQLDISSDIVSLVLSYQLTSTSENHRILSYLLEVCMARWSL